MKRWQGGIASKGNHKEGGTMTWGWRHGDRDARMETWDDRDRGMRPLPLLRAPTCRVDGQHFDDW